MKQKVWIADTWNGTIQRAEGETFETWFKNDEYRIDNEDPFEGKVWVVELEDAVQRLEGDARDRNVIAQNVVKEAEAFSVVVRQNIEKAREQEKAEKERK